MVPYAIVAPPKSFPSAGIRALHVLADELTARGYTAVTVDPQSTTPMPGYIVIYPEVIFGNPLRSDKVVRWTLNVPGLLGGDKEYPETEYVWTWSKDYYDAPVLTVDTIEHDIFFADETPKTFDCAYFGKGDYRGVERITKTLHMPEINRKNPPWPPTRQDVGELLRHTRTLYTYDDRTQLIDEAWRCGCRVVLLPEDRELVRDDSADIPDHSARIDAFIEATQARWS